jgi:hypothetical protein
MKKNAADELRKILEAKGIEIDDDAHAAMRQYCEGLVEPFAEIEGFPLDVNRVIGYLRAVANDIQNGLIKVKGFELDERAETTTYSVEFFNIEPDEENEAGEKREPNLFGGMRLAAKSKHPIPMWKPPTDKDDDPAA